MKRGILTVVCVFVLAGCATGIKSGYSRCEPVFYSVQGEFQNIVEDIEFAITDRGLVISHTFNIAAMLRRTQDVTGIPPPYKEAKVIEFCSASLSSRMLAEDPGRILFCPYRIAVYSPVNTPRKVFIAFSPVSCQTDGVLKEIDVLIRSIIEDAIQMSSD